MQATAGEGSDKLQIEKLYKQKRQAVKPAFFVSYLPNLFAGVISFFEMLVPFFCDQFIVSFILQCMKQFMTAGVVIPLEAM